MLLTRNHHRQRIISLSPCHDVHHRLLAGCTGSLPHAVVKAHKKSVARFSIPAPDDETWHHIARHLGQIVVFVALHQLHHLTAEPLPFGLQRHKTTRTGLQMQVVGGTGSAFGTVVEHHETTVGFKQTVYLYEVFPYALGLVPARSYREVHGKNGERIHQQFKIVVEHLHHLLFRAVGLAEKAGPAAERRAVELGPRRHDAGRVELHFQRIKRACLHITQVAVAPAGILPHLQLTVEKPRHRVVGILQVILTTVHLPTGLYLHRAQPVFITVVGVHAIDAQCGIAIASPTTAKIQFVVDASYAVAAAESQSQRIVFAVACIRKLHLPQQGGKESTRSP